MVCVEVGKQRWRLSASCMWSLQGKGKQGLCWVRTVALRTGAESSSETPRADGSGYEHVRLCPICMTLNEHTQDRRLAFLVTALITVNQPTSSP